MLFASIEGRKHRVDTESVKGNKSAPTADAPRKPSLFRNLEMIFDHIRIFLLFGLVIIPINGNDIVGKTLDDVLGNLCLGNKIFSAAPRTEIHIRPDHQLVVIFLCNFADAFQVACHQGVDILVAIAVKVLSATEHMRFVHTNMDFSGREAFRKSRKHMVDKLVGSLIVDHQNVAAINGELLPAKRCIEVCQRLNARNDGHSERSGKRVDLLHFCLRVATAHITEVGLAVYLIGVLGVEHHAVVTDLFQKGKKPLESVHTHHGVSRHIDHDTEGVKILSHSTSSLFRLVLSDFINIITFSTEKSRFLKK